MNGIKNSKAIAEKQRGTLKTLLVRLRNPTYQPMQRLIHHLRNPRYLPDPQDPQDPHYEKPVSPLNNQRSMLSAIHRPQNQPLAKPRNALDHVHQTRGTLNTLLESMKQSNNKKL